MVQDAAEGDMSELNRSTPAPAEVCLFVCNYDDLKVD